MSYYLSTSVLAPLAVSRGGILRAEHSLQHLLPDGGARDAGHRRRHLVPERGRHGGDDGPEQRAPGLRRVDHRHRLRLQLREEGVHAEVFQGLGLHPGKRTGRRDRNVRRNQKGADAAAAGGGTGESRATGGRGNACTAASSWRNGGGGGPGQGLVQVHIGFVKFI